MTTKKTISANSMRARARKVRLLLLDVDGVLTDGSLHYDGSGRETKTFHAWDGIGIRLLQEIAKIPTAIVSGRGSAATRSRAKDLGIRELHLGIKDKSKAFQAILKKHRLKPSEVCGVGDDVVDLPFLNKVGLSVAPANAHRMAKKAAHYVTKIPGGHGAVREVAEIILNAQGKWSKAMRRYQP